MKKDKKNRLTRLIEKTVSDSDKETLKVGEVVDKLGSRGFGPLLIIPCIFVILPTGFLPGVPAVAGTIIAFCSFQIMIGKERPWLPEKIRNLSMKRQKAEDAFDRKKKFIKKIDKVMNRRLEVLTHNYMQRITGGLTFFLALGMISIGFIPFAPDMMSLPILLFGLGYIAHDGLFVLLGFLLLIGAAFLIPLM